MQKFYTHMLSPVKLGRHILKNRLLSSCCMPHFISGPESWMAEPAMTFFENLAKAGAALVTVRDQNMDTSKIPADDIRHTPWWHLDDPKVQNYHSQLCERIHFQGSLASALFLVEAPMGYDVCACESIPLLGQSAEPDADAPLPAHRMDAPAPGAPKDMPPIGAPGDMPPAGLTMDMPPLELGPNGFPMAKELSAEQLHQLAKDAAKQARLFQSLGFDAVTMHMAYQGPLLAKFISPLTNHRTDKYGGSVENRARFPHEVFAAIKKACGRDFIIEIEISGEEPEGGNTLADAVALAKALEDVVDIVQLRQGSVDPSHPTGYSWDGKTPKTLEYAAAFKAAGIKSLISPSGGFGDFEQIDKAIADGLCDTVDMARAFMVDPDYIHKAREGRAEDRIPCVRCNKCHHIPKDKWVTICSVNPMLGLAHSEKAMVSPPDRKKNVAVIGGGPAGMRAALFCRERGHTVTLFEKSGVLGGQLIHADYPAFKWPLKKYKDYLIGQVTKDEGITVAMNTEATPELIADGGFDAAIVATGSVPVLPPIPGADEAGAWTPIGVYGHEQELGKRVVVVGGGASATETGVYLADCGHDVTVLTRQPALASDHMGVHFYSMMKEYWERLPNFRGIVNAVTESVAPGRVCYTDGDGKHVIECDSIVLSGGVRSEDEKVMAFWNCVPEVVTAGDCRSPGALDTVNFTAYSAACRT